MRDEEKSVYIDLLRIFAVIEVIAIHLSVLIVPLYGVVPNDGWWTANAIRSFSASAVPLFILISGTLVIKNESFEIFYKKRFLKIFFPLIVWSIIYIIFRIFFLKEKLNLSEIFREFFLTGKGLYFHLWFFYLIVILYAIAPFLYLYFEKNKNNIKFFIFFSLLIGILHFSKIFSIYLNSFALGFWYYFSSLFYFSMGYYLKDKRLNVLLLICLLIFSFLIVCFGNYYFNLYKEDRMFHFYNPLIILMSLSLFLLFKEFFIKIKKMKFSREMAATTFGIYLIHPIAIWFFLEKMKLNDYLLENPSVWLPLMIFLIYAVSFLIITFLRKIPVLKFIVP